MPHRVTTIFSLVTALALTVALAPEPAAAIDWPFFGASKELKPGTPEWWKKHKGKKVYVRGEGFQVPGFEGYFDSEGRPIDAPVDKIITSLSTKEEQVGLLPGLDPKKHVKSVKEAIGQGPNQQFSEQALSEGKKLFNEAKYGKAASLFKQAASRWPSSAVEAEALFLLGESYYWQNKYVDARDTFDNLVSKHPNTRYLDTLIGRQWLIAQYWESYHFDYQSHSWYQPNVIDKTRPTFDTIGHAIKTYENIRLNDPTGPWADDAIMATAGIHFRNLRFEDADHHYSELRREYPRSEHQFKAHILGLQAKLRMYQGADYDGTALEDSQKLLKQINTQFAGRLNDEEKEQLRVAQAEVSRASEERELKMAQFYDNTSHFGAARQSYAMISRKYGDSPVAQQARDRLAALDGLPSHPDKPVAWLVEWLPESRERSLLKDIPEIRDAQTRLAENPEAQGGTVQR